MTLFPLKNGHQRITLVCEIISVWKGWRVILPKGEYSSQNDNIFTFELDQLFGATTNINKFSIATGGLVLASGDGEHRTGGLVAARSLAAVRLGR